MSDISANDPLSLSVKPTPDSAHRHNWIPALCFFMPASSVAAICGSQALTLGLPTAWFVYCSAACMVVLCLISSLITSPKLASALLCTGFACVAYGPLLITIGSTEIPLSRSLTHEESKELRQKFSTPLLQSSDEDGQHLRIKRGHLTEAMSQHLQSIHALGEAPRKPLN